MVRQLSNKFIVATIVNPQYEYLRDWINLLPENFTLQGEVIYNARNQIRFITAPDGTELCVKRFHTPAVLNGWIYMHWRKPKAVRAYLNAIKLNNAGVSTPESIACILITKNSCLRQSYLICRRSLLKRNFYEFRHHPLDGYEHIVKAFARFTANMHEQCILHQDYSPGNILFDLNQDGQPEFEIVDINRIRFNHPITIDEACRNFCRLWGKEDFFILLATEYAHARGFNIEQCKQMTIRYWKRFWRFRK